ncbi:hypothetical protein J6590_096258 [Homalodisca vitripennis]|nr:hypothetical protein J6590_096258 [Homalodisca vitripennis]
MKSYLKSKDGLFRGDFRTTTNGRAGGLLARTGSLSGLSSKQQPRSTSLVPRNCSNATQLCLHKVSLALSGRYSCEVSADSPSFKTAQVSGYMDVVVTPTHRPELRGMKPRYRVGDKLSASCISRHSRPPANLTWSINGSPVDRNINKVNIQQTLWISFLKPNRTGSQRESQTREGHLTQFAVGPGSLSCLVHGTAVSGVSQRVRVSRLALQTVQPEYQGCVSKLPLRTSKVDCP